MAKAAEANNDTDNRQEEEQAEIPVIDSKYRMIIVAAQRSKQLQRGARSRIEMDIQRHKPTRVAVEEVQRGKVEFTYTDRD